MRPRTILTAVSLLLSADLMQAQSVSWSGPTSGVVYDAPTRSLRPIIGLPGSAYLGESLASELDGAWVAPNGDRAVVLRQGQLSAVADLTQAAPRWMELGLEVSDQSKMAWSGDSSTLLFTTDAGGSLQWARWQDGTLNLAERAVLPAGALVSALRCDRTGTSAVLVVQAEAGTALYTLQPGLDPLPLSEVSAGTILAPVQGQEALLAVDGAARRVLLVTLSQAAPTVSVLYESADETTTLSGALWNATSHSLFLFDASNHFMNVIDTDSGQTAASTELESDPDALSLLPRPGLYLLSARAKSQQPLYLFDAVSGGIFFVPAPGDQQ